MLPATSLSHTADREYGLDALRVFAFAILIFYHSGMGYVSWDWHVKNPEKSVALEWIMLASNRWRLPLLFFISGAGVYFSLRRRTYGQFAAERLQRLLVPVIFAMLVVIPPQIYFERLYHGATFSYAEFYPSVFEFQAYPQGSFSWHHLWFVVYILVFSTVGLPVLMILRSSAGRRAIAAMTRLFQRVPAAIYLINVPNLLVAVVLGPRWPTTHNLVSDWATLTGTFLTFLWGFAIASNRDFLDMITRRRREFALVGLALASAFYILRATGWSAGWSPTLRLWIGNLLSGYWGMTWIFALIGYARTYWNRPSRFLSWATETVYPFYIVHQTVTVATVYLLIPAPIGVWPKFAITVFATFGGSAVLVEIVRSVRPLRPLFGLKLQKKVQPAVATAARS